MLYFIGLGLHDESDMSLKGLETLKRCDEVYAEFYTNPFCGDPKSLEKMAGKKVFVLKRADLEENPSENVLKNAGELDVALIVSGDPMVATTHIDLMLRAKKKGIGCRVIHSSSIYSAVAETGLQIYKFGKTASIAYPCGGYFPTSPYDTLKENLGRGLHTLFLLDVKAEENRFMSVGGAIGLLLEMEKQKKAGIFDAGTLCVGVARLGGEALIKAGAAGELAKEAFGKPPHCLIIPGKLHYMEEEALASLQTGKIQ